MIGYGHTHTHTHTIVSIVWHELLLLQLIPLSLCHYIQPVSQYKHTVYIYTADVSDIQINSNIKMKFIRIHSYKFLEPHIHKKWWPYVAAYLAKSTTALISICEKKTTKGCSAVYSIRFYLFRSKFLNNIHQITPKVPWAICGCKRISYNSKWIDVIQYCVASIW